MNAPTLDRLSPRQRELVDGWLPGAVVEADHSWGLVETTVLELDRRGERFILKAGGPSDRHLAREVQAHQQWLTPWTRRGRAPCLLHHDLDAKVLVTTYLPGRLVLGTPHAAAPETYRQAGRLLALLHEQTSVVDAGYERRENGRTLAWLDGPHRIPPDLVERLRLVITSWPTPRDAVVVPTHGDWQPRNWLIHEGVVSAIDFGRAALRPAMSDLARLAAQDFRRSPALEDAFLDGYGSDPREPAAWFRLRVREAVGTAAWAYAVGAEGFEAQGHRMIADALGG